MAAREGPGQDGRARRPREHAGRSRPRRRRQRRRDRRAQVRDRLRRQVRAVQDASPRTWPTLVAAKARPRSPSVRTQLDDLEDHARRRTSSSVAVVRFEAAPGNVLDSYLHIQGGRGVNAVLVELEGGTPELAHDIAVHIAFARPKYLSRDEVPGRRRREGARHARGHHPQRGQARAGDAQDRRGPAQRLLQGDRACSSSRTPRTTSRPISPAARRRPPIVRFAQVEIG